MGKCCKNRFSGLLKMVNKTRDLILKVLNEEMESGKISKKLEEKGHNVNYDTICRNLNAMFKEGILNRYAKGKELNENTERKHWNFYYSLKN